ncbi:hypothetical protein EP7_003209 [Isosphaeraceae bacterium EP7]
MKRPLVQILLLWAASAVSAPTFAPAADDAKASPIEVHEWSIWVGQPAQPNLNGTRIYRNAMPDVVGTSRAKFEEKDLAAKFPIAPISVVQAYGEPTKDVDIEIRAKKGTFVAHWPPSTDRGGRIQWFGSDLLAALPPGIPENYLPETHWFQTLRASKPALYVKNETRTERFLAYDTELTTPVPVRLRGGPDEYTLQNLTGRTLVDIAVIAPAAGGFRVGWLDELPTAAPAKEEEKKDDKSAKKTAEEKAEAVFEEGEKAPKAKDDALTPIPAEGDADVRAQVDQILNRPITLAVDRAPRKDAISLIAGQARLSYELDDKALAKAEVDMSLPATLKVGQGTARDSLSDVLAGAGLSYRITENGSLYITTAARLAEDNTKKGAAVEGPPIKLTMGQPLMPSSPSYREVTHDSLARRLKKQGLRDESARLLLERYGKNLFEPGELIVLAHLSRDAIDEAVLLDVFPPPKTFVRTALVVTHGIDPRLQDKARTLVQQLGDATPKTRESAETRLQELGAAAIPVLEDALKDKDIEVVFRAERLLLRLNRQVP